MRKNLKDLIILMPIILIILVMLIQLGGGLTVDYIDQPLGENIQAQMQEQKPVAVSATQGNMTEISYYSEYDSCHNPVMVEGIRKCLTANGDIAGIGTVATWLYDIGTVLEIDGQQYIVQDRTSKSLPYRNRVDIWTGYGQEGHDKAIANGIDHKEVKVIK